MNQEEQILVMILDLKVQCYWSSLYDYADAYILVKRTITITDAGNDDAAKQADERGKGVTFKNWAPFAECISRIKIQT